MTGGIPIPGLASWLSDPSTGKETVVKVWIRYRRISGPPFGRPTSSTCAGTSWWAWGRCCFWLSGTRCPGFCDDACRRASGFFERPLLPAWQR